MSLLKKRQEEFKTRLIAEVAYDLFVHRPLEMVTVEDIARKVGCGKGTLYKYFRNKEHILTYLVLQGLGELCEDIKQKCVNNTDIIQALRSYITLQFYFYLDYNQIFSSWQRCRLDNRIEPEWEKEVNDKFEEKMKMAETILNNGIRKKLILAFNSYELARLLETVFRDLTLSPLGTREKVSNPESTLEMLTTILTRGLLREKK